MAQSNLTTLDGLMKNVYLPGLPSWVNTKRPLWGRIEKITDKKRFSGRNMIFAAMNATAEGSGQVGESETLPVAVAGDPQNMQIALKYYYGVVKLSAQVISLSESSEGAFADAFKTETNGIRDRVEEDLAIDGIFGDGTGARGTVSAYSGTTLTMKSQATKGELGTRLLRKGMLLSSYSAKSGGSQGADAKSVASVLSTTTANVGSSAGFVANDYVFRAVTAGTDPRNKSMMGLAGIVDDGTNVGTFQNLSRTTYPALKSNVLGNSGTLRAWSSDLMDEACMESWLNGSGVYPTAIYGPLEIQRRAAAHLRADRNFDMSVKTWDGGYKGIEWTFPGGTAPWFVDRFAVPNNMKFVHEPHLCLAIGEDIQFEERDGSMFRFTGRTHDVEAWMFTWRNFLARACNSHTLLDDISHTL